jgi:RNAse (barnase) inhibitor barstar
VGGEIRRIQLDARDWLTRECVYAGLLAALEAPAWHGHNFDALRDSIVVGSINKVEPPFSIEISHAEMASQEAQQFLRSLAELFQEFEREGCPVSFKLD